MLTVTIDQSEGISGADIPEQAVKKMRTGSAALSLPSPRAFFAFLFTERLFTTISEPGTGYVLPNCHYDDALIQSGITALSQRREEVCINFIKRDCLSSPVIKPLISCVSIDRPNCLHSGERVPLRLVPKTKRFADFCTIKFQDQL